MESKIIWSINALRQLEDVHFYLLFESKSITVADKVVEAIFDSTVILKTNPEIYKLDKLRNNNDGTFRTYFIYEFKISYRITPTSIQILRIRHNARKPRKL